MSILPKVLKNLIEKLTILPGVGPKSAQRMALHILQYKKAQTLELAHAINDCIENIITCAQCKNFSEQDPCSICSDPSRNQKTICVVETLSDLISIEQTGVYQGVYFVLSGHLSPIEQIGPEQLHIPSLLAQIESGGIEEVILATNATVEGETTAHYITSHIDPKVKITRLASGIPVGAQLEFLNSNTLFHAILERKEVT